MSAESFCLSPASYSVICKHLHFNSPPLKTQRKSAVRFTSAPLLTTVMRSALGLFYRTDYFIGFRYNQNIMPLAAVTVYSVCVCIDIK